MSLQMEYTEVASRTDIHPLDLIGIKEKLIFFSIGLSDAFARTKQLHLEAQQERDNAYTLQYIKEREEIDETTKKPQSVANAERNAKLKIAGDYITERHADINYTIVKKILSDAQLLIDTAIQRVSVVKGDMFNSRQPNQI